MANQCKSQNQKGEQCAAQPVRPSGYCYWHDPALEEQRQVNNARGGKNRSNEQRAKKELRKYEDAELIAILSTVLSGLLQGKYEPGVATAAATVARTITQIRTSTELEARIQELEKAAGMVDTSRTIRRIS